MIRLLPVFTPEELRPRQQIWFSYFVCSIKMDIVDVWQARKSQFAASEGTQGNMAYAIGLPFGLVLAYPWPTFWASVGIPVGVPWRTSGWRNLYSYRPLRECGRVVKPEGWGARYRGSIPDVGIFQNANVLRRVFEFDVRSLNHDMDIK